MWIDMLTKILVVVVPKIIEQISKEKQRGFAMADNTHAVAEIRQGLTDTLAQLELIG